MLQLYIEDSLALKNEIKVLKSSQNFKIDSETSQLETLSCEQNPSECNETELCELATHRIAGAQRGWKSGTFKKFVDEAKRRNLTCGLLEPDSLKEIEIEDNNQIWPDASECTGAGGCSAGNKVSAEQLREEKAKRKEEEAEKRAIEEEMRADKEEARLAAEAENKRKAEEEAVKRENTEMALYLENALSGSSHDPLKIYQLIMWHDKNCLRGIWEDRCRDFTKLNGLIKAFSFIADNKKLLIASNPSLLTNLGQAHLALAVHQSGANELCKIPLFRAGCFEVAIKTNNNGSLAIAYLKQASQLGERGAITLLVEINNLMGTNY